MAVLALIRLRQLVQECVWELRLVLLRSLGLLPFCASAPLSLCPLPCLFCSIMGPVSLLGRLSLCPALVHVASCHFFPSTRGFVLFSGGYVHVCSFFWFRRFFFRELWTSVSFEVAGRSCSLQSTGAPQVLSHVLVTSWQCGFLGTRVGEASHPHFGSSPFRSNHLSSQDFQGHLALIIAPSLAVVGVHLAP